MALGHLALIVDNLPEALGRLEAVVNLARALDDRPDLAYALAFLGLTQAYGTRDPTSGAEGLLVESLDLLGRLQDAWGQAFVNDLRADVTYNLSASLPRRYVTASGVLRYTGRWAIGGVSRTNSRAWGTWRLCRAPMV